MRILLLLASLCVPLHAATFTVTNLNDSGAGSLRDAMTQAEATAGADEIVFAAGLAPGTITLLTALPDITESLTITGPASNNLMLQRDVAAPDFRIFTITGGTVSISHLWIGHGRATGTDGLSGGEGLGGGIYVSGGTLALSHCLVHDCVARGGDGTIDGGEGSGGGIYASVPLALYDVAFVNCEAIGGNQATSASVTGGFAVGAGVYALVSLVAVRCTFADCNAFGGLGSVAEGIALGGALYSGGTSDIADSSFRTCGCLRASGSTLGVSVLRVAGNLTMRRCSFHDCTCAALWLSGTSCLVTNSTFSGNHAGSTSSAVRMAAGTTTLRFCTITNNSGQTGGVLQTGGTLQVEGCIIAGNSGTGSSPDVAGTFTDLGFNLIGDGAGASGFTTSVLVGSAISPINPSLGPLVAFSTTYGHIPNWGSFAIDQGGPNAPFDDQRGANRLISSPADIGAVEFIPNQAPSFTTGGVVSAPGNSSTVTVAAWATNISAGAPWEAGQGLTFVIVGTSAPFEQFPAIDPVTGDLTFRGGRGYSGVWVFDVYLVDDGGTQGGGNNISLAGFLVIDIERSKEKSSSDEYCSTGTGRSHYAALALLAALAMLGLRLRRA